MIIDLDDLTIALGLKLHLTDILVERANLGPGKFILEAGCGSGKLGLNLVVRTRAAAVLVDSDPATVMRALRNLAAAEDLTGARFPVMVEPFDITKLPYQDRIFDLVFNEGVIEHFKDPTVILREMARVSRDLVAAIVPNADNAKQRLLAKRQTEAYAGKDHWAAYEKPMTIEELVDHMKAAGLKDVQAWHVWRDSTDPEQNTNQFRLVMGMGKV